jgi:AcrR family transcriptional regulator
MRKLSRNEWIGGAFEALTEGGIDALRVEPLAKRLGVTKGSFYHHFENRRALHLAMLVEWERRGTAQIIDGVEEVASDPIDQLRALANATFGIDPVGDAIETNIRSWAATDQVVAAAVSRVDDRRLGFVAGLLREAGMSKALAERRARLMYRVLIGEFIWRTAGGPASTKKELDEMAAMLLAGLDGA